MVRPCGRVCGEASSSGGRYNVYENIAPYTLVLIFGPATSLVVAVATDSYRQNLFDRKISAHQFD